MNKMLIATLPIGAFTLLATPAFAACNRALANYDMPAQRLDQASQQLAHVSGCFVAMDPAMVADRRAPAVKGHFTPEQALARLVRGSGYAAYATADGLAFDANVLDISMSQARVLRTALQNKVKAGTLAPGRATQLRATLKSVEHALPRQVNAQGMVTQPQKQDAIQKLDMVRNAVGPVTDARGWESFKRKSA